MRNLKIFLIIIIGFLVYGNSLLNGFVWDDAEQILNNNSVHSIFNLPSFFLGGTFNTGGMALGNSSSLYYRPLMSTFFATVYTLFSPRAWAFHLVQIIFHIANTILIYFIFKRLLKKDNLSWFLAVIYLIHPINSETVVYISNYQEVLFVFFGLLSIFTAIPALSAAFLLLSLLSKETALIMVLITFFYHFLYRRKDLKIFLVYLMMIAF